MNILRNKKFEKVVITWLLFKEVQIKESTFYRYKYIIEKYILPYFKDKRLFYFFNYDFNLYIHQLSKKLSPKTIADTLTLLKNILKYAEKKYNFKYNLELIPLPKSKQEEIKILEVKEEKRLENYCLSSRNYKKIGIAMCLLTGMRVGEICALKWKNIDLKNKLIYIKENIQRIYVEKKKTKIIIDTPKTNNSIRAIPISKKLLTVLKKLKKEKKFNEEDYFLTGNQKFLEPRCYQAFFKRCLKNSNIKDYNFHVLRHTFATNCIKIGMDAKSLSKILGHSNVKITLNRYVHSSLDTQKTYLDKL